MTKKGEARAARKRNPHWAGVLKNGTPSKRTVKRRMERLRQIGKSFSDDPWETDWLPGEAN